MADNLTLNAGSGGADLRTDELASGKHVQYVKLMDGTADGDTVVSADGDGLEVNVSSKTDRDMGKIDVASLDQYTPNTGRLPVYADVATIAAGDNNIGNVDIVTVPAPLSTTGAGTVATALRTTLGSDDPAVVALQIIDDWDDSNYCNVNMNVAGTDVAAGAGAVNAQTLRVTHASDDPVTTALQLIDNAISGAGFNITQFGGASVPIGAGLEATAVRVTLPTNGTGIVGLAAGTNAIGKLAANSGVDIGDVDVASIVPGVAATNLGKAEDAGHTSGDVGVMALAIRDDTLASVAGTELDYEPLHLTATGALWVTPVPVASGGGLSFNKNIDVDESEDAVSASPCQLYGYYFYNAATSARYLKLYNATTANVTVGTTTPDLTMPLPAGAAGHISFSHGITFSTALTIAATTGIADNDTGAPSANDVAVMTFYK